MTVLPALERVPDVELLDRARWSKASSRTGRRVGRTSGASDDGDSLGCEPGCQSLEKTLRRLSVGGDAPPQTDLLLRRLVERAA